jgi:AraC-like DNA-binding protein
MLFSFGPDGELVGSTRGGGITFASLIWEPGILEQRAEALGLSIDTSDREGPSSTPDPAAMHELRAAVGQTLEVARSDPARLGRPEVREALGDTIVTAAVRALHPAPERRSVAAVSHVRAVRAAFDVLEARAGDPIYLAELCRAAKVSERTLRSAFQNLYGVSPIRYLALRRMELVRRALRDAEPRETRVSAIASRYGFTNLGRFAMEFRQLYGESPSQTLRRA